VGERGQRRRRRGSGGGNREGKREIEEGAIALFLLDPIDYILPIFIVHIGLVSQATKRDILLDCILLS
jgi:hypothetical protein